MNKFDDTHLARLEVRKDEIKNQIRILERRKSNIEKEIELVLSESPNPEQVAWMIHAVASSGEGDDGVEYDRIVEAIRTRDDIGLADVHNGFEYAKETGMVYEPVDGRWKGA